MAGQYPQKFIDFLSTANKERATLSPRKQQLLDAMMKEVGYDQVPGTPAYEIRLRHAAPPPTATGDPNAGDKRGFFEKAKDRTLAVGEAMMLPVTPEMAEFHVGAAEAPGGWVYNVGKTMVKGDWEARGAAGERISEAWKNRNDPKWQNQSFTDKMYDASQIGRDVFETLPVVGPMAAGVGRQLESTDPRERDRAYGAIAAVALPTGIKKAAAVSPKVAKFLEHSGELGQSAATTNAPAVGWRRAKIGMEDLMEQKVDPTTGKRLPSKMHTIMKNRNTVAATQEGLVRKYDVNAEQAGAELKQIMDDLYPTGTKAIDPKAVADAVWDAAEPYFDKTVPPHTVTGNSGRVYTVFKGRTGDATRYIENLIKETDDLFQSGDVQHAVTLERELQRKVAAKKGWRSRQGMGKDLDVDDPEYAKRELADPLSRAVDEATPEAVPSRRQIHASRSAQEILKAALEDPEKMRGIERMLITGSLKMRMGGYATASAVGGPGLQTVAAIMATLDGLRAIARSTLRRTLWARIKFDLGQMIEAGATTDAAQYVQKILDKHGIKAGNTFQSIGAAQQAQQGQQGQPGTVPTRPSGPYTRPTEPPPVPMPRALQELGDVATGPVREGAGGIEGIEGIEGTVTPVPPRPRAKSSPSTPAPAQVLVDRPQAEYIRRTDAVKTELEAVKARILASPNRDLTLFDMKENYGKQAPDLDRYVDLVREQDALLQQAPQHRAGFVDEAAGAVPRRPVALETKAKATAKPTTTPTDNLYPQALKVAQDYGRVSPSLLQRKLQIGFGRAERLVKTMRVAGEAPEGVAPNAPRKPLSEEVAPLRPVTPSKVTETPVANRATTSAKSKPVESKPVVTAKPANQPTVTSETETAATPTREERRTVLDAVKGERIRPTLTAEQKEAIKNFNAGNPLNQADATTKATTLRTMTPEEKTIAAAQGRARPQTPPPVGWNGIRMNNAGTYDVVVDGKVVFKAPTKGVAEAEFAKRGASPTTPTALEAKPPKEERTNQVKPTVPVRKVVEKKVTPDYGTLEKGNIPAEITNLVTEAAKKKWDFKKVYNVWRERGGVEQGEKWKSVVSTMLEREKARRGRGKSTTQSTEVVDDALIATRPTKPLTSQEVMTRKRDTKPSITTDHTFPETVTDGPYSSDARVLKREWDRDLKAWVETLGGKAKLTAYGDQVSTGEGWRTHVSVEINFPERWTKVKGLKTAQEIRKYLTSIENEMKPGSVAKRNRKPES